MYREDVLIHNRQSHPTPDFALSRFRAEHSDKNTMLPDRRYQLNSRLVADLYGGPGKKDCRNRTLMSRILT